jgi:membrane protease subunit HflC
MKNLPSILAAIFLVGVLALYMCTFQVRSTEVAILKTFGQANEEPIEVSDQDQSFFAGLHFKWPWPIQSVAKYDRRIRLLEDRIEETPTQDSKQIIITTFTGWTISDPYKFHKQYQTVEAGEKALRDRIRSEKKAIIGRHDFSEFVSTDPADRKLPEIEDELMASVAGMAQADFGIRIEMFGIKQLTLPQSVTEAVFKTMKTAQTTKAEAYRSEGEAAAKKIIADAEQARSRILAVVSHKVSSIESEAQAEVGRIYEKFQEHPELRMYLDELRAFRELLRDRSTLFLDPTMSPINVMDPDRRVRDGSVEIKTITEAPPAPASASQDE